LIADQAVFPVAVRRVQEALEAGGIATHVLTLHSGEQAKSLESLQQVYAWLARLRVERIDTVVALGGGVMGDLAGFAAATWLRGVAFVQVPTSLAAMVDASLGGKVAANLPQGKNLVGAFHQPKLVLSDVDLLATLPKRELAAGWAEAIKHGLILDPALLNDFERQSEALSDLGSPEATDIIRRSVAIKAKIVSADEYERGDTRILLNYGHTIGHAIEAVTEFGEYLHGEAVAIGMMGAATIGTRLGMIDEELVDRQRRVFTQFGLPLAAPGLDADAIVAATKADKKSRGGAIRWVMLEDPGRATTRQDVPDELVADVVRELVHLD
jgi:3-dehydroquinate synthase